MTWIEPVVVAAACVAVLLIVDRLTARGVFDRRSDRPRAPRPRGGGGGAGALGGLLNFYDPSHEHVTEEQQREKSMTLHVVGEGEPLIDLDSGATVLERPQDDPDQRA